MVFYYLVDFSKRFHYTSFERLYLHFVMTQEVKLTNENDVRVLDLENCSRLSDIVVGDGSGGNVAVAGATTMLKSDELSKEGVKGRRLNLRGCDMLSMSTKSNLKSVVLRSVS